MRKEIILFAYLDQCFRLYRRVNSRPGLKRIIEILRFCLHQKIVVQTYIAKVIYVYVWHKENDVLIVVQLRLLLHLQPRRVFYINLLPPDPETRDKKKKS